MLKAASVVFFLFVSVSFADQRSGSAALDRAVRAFREGKLNEAETQAEVAVRNNAHKPEAINLLGAILTRRKLYSEAEGQFQAALALEPEYYPAKLNYAELELLRGNYQKATELYEELQRADPKSELVQFNLVLCSLLSGSDGQLASRVDSIIFPGLTPAYYYARAAIALKQGQKSSALAYFDLAKKYYSDAQCAYFRQSLTELGLLPTEPEVAGKRSPKKS